MARIATIVLLASVYNYAWAVNNLCPAHLPKTAHLFQYKGFCYELVLDHPRDWHEAKADCETKKGYLTDIHTIPEETYMLNEIKIIREREGISEDTGLWIGMTDEGSEGNWRWVSGVPVGFQNWAKDQPGVMASYENCALMEFSGLWHDYPCAGFMFTTERHGWVCKYDILT